MNVRVVPVHARRLVLGNFKFVLENVRRLDGGVERVVLMADWCNHQAMKMKIGGTGIHGATATGRSHGVTSHWCGGSRRREAVFQRQNQLIAWMQTQIRRLSAVFS